MPQNGVRNTDHKNVTSITKEKKQQQKKTYSEMRPYSHKQIRSWYNLSKQYHQNMTSAQ